MKSVTEWRDARVIETRTIARDVRMIVFSVEYPMPRFEPGSHTNVALRIGDAPAIRSYTCLPAPAGEIRVAVKRHANSRGGSDRMWTLETGDAVRLTLPENRFELSWRAPNYLLIAGGIGVTPIYGMAMALAARGAPIRMVYGAQSTAHMAFRAELRDALGERLALFAHDEGGRIDIDSEIAALPEGGELYVCGPLGLLNAAEAAWKRQRRPVSRLRYEVFGDSGRHAEEPFELHVKGRDRTLTVAAGETMLEALLRSGIDMIYDCRRGECGLCAVDVVTMEGEIDHRDVFFSDSEKADNAKMCACVSRLTGGRAVIDIGYRA